MIASAINDKKKNKEVALVTLCIRATRATCCEKKITKCCKIKITKSCNWFATTITVSCKNCNKAHFAFFIQFLNKRCPIIPLSLIHI